MKRATLLAGAALIALGAATAGAYAQDANGPREGKGPRFDMSQIDTDGDGKISTEEREAHRAARFAEIDANGDGSVDQDEILAHMETKRQERMADRAAKMIECRDGDSDGKLTMDEMMPKPGADLFASLDADGDGAISEDEFAKMAEMRPERGPKGDRAQDHGNRMERKMDQRGPKGDREHAERGEHGHRKGDHGPRAARMGERGMFGGPRMGMMGDCGAPQGAAPQAGEAPMPPAGEAKPAE
ncbi:EF-hand domain-containing protein [Pseudooceanicola nanhaiensis]|uniref:EF-hand domain-containing protein n=1 Tax=Pseudooceanicola nanhaiensis TaxID=375761 RepID=UPI001CD6379C|nr:EF-hand domain-containing protein [Pseudooceanicola nanhaiensis]MCA0920116.1 EF-hand domain-containing protein [Pseudooceanicola nanhaiensis]